MPSVRAVLTAALVVPVAYIVVGASQQHSGIDAGGDVCGGRGGNDLKQLGGNGVTPGMPADDPSKPSLEIQTGTLVDDAGKKRQHDTAQLETGGKEAASRGDRARESCKSSDDCPVMIDSDNDEVNQCVNGLPVCDAQSRRQVWRMLHETQLNRTGADLGNRCFMWLLEFQQSCICCWDVGTWTHVAFAATHRSPAVSAAVECIAYAVARQFCSKVSEHLTCTSNCQQNQIMDFIV